jgi:ribosomal protein S25
MKVYCRHKIHQPQKNTGGKNGKKMKKKKKKKNKKKKKKKKKKKPFKKKQEKKRSIYTEYYMSKSVSHAVSTREPYITSRATDQRGDVGRGLKLHVIQILTCNVHYI